MRIMLVERVKDSSPAFQMLISGYRGDPFGGEYCSDANFFDEMVSADSKDIAEVLHGNQFQILQLVGYLCKVQNAILRLVVGQNVIFVHVFSSSFEVDESNSIVEYAFYFLYLRTLEFEAFYHFFYNLLRFFVMAEVGVELVDQVGLAVLLGTFDFFFFIPIPGFLHLDFGLSGWFWRFRGGLLLWE